MGEDEEVARALEKLLGALDSRADASEASRRLMAGVTSPARVFEMAPEDIMRLSGISREASGAVAMVSELGRYAGVERKGAAPRLDSARARGDYFGALCRGRRVEYCYLACLDDKKRLIRCALMGKGAPESYALYVRAIAQTALRTGAKYAVLCHTHPGGTLKPSRQDIELTRRVQDALKLIGVTLLEHVIVTRSGAVGIMEEEDL